MACLEGQTLKQNIAARPLPLPEALDIALQVAQGLQAAHEKSVVHRDIKPANIMITRRGQVKIMDFGLALLSDRTRLTATGMKLGTPAYMAPEQTEGKPADMWKILSWTFEIFAGTPRLNAHTEESIHFSKNDPALNCGNHCYWRNFRLVSLAVRTHTESTSSRARSATTIRTAAESESIHRLRRSRCCSSDALIPQHHRPVLRGQLMNALLLAAEGKRQAALEAMTVDVVNFAAKRIFWTGDLAEFYAVLGDTSTALDWLERAVRGGDKRAEWFQRDSLLASLRPTERFKNIQSMISFRRQGRKLSEQQ